MKRPVQIGLGAGVIAAVALYGILYGARYRQHPAAATAPDVQAAIEVIRAMAASPEAAREHLSADVTQLAANNVLACAAQLSKASPVEFTRADWFGDYLRVGVRCRTPEGIPLEAYFLFKKEAGRLRVTGLQR